MHDLKIRLAGFGDNEVIKKIFLEALQTDPTAFTSSYEEYVSASNEWWLQYLTPYTNAITTKLWLAEVANTPIGMIGLLKNTRIRMNHVASIVWFWVKKDYRGKGTGRKLFESLLEFVDSDLQIKKLGLTVTAKQEGAIKLYKKYGFETIGVQKDEIRLGTEYIDFLSMEKFVK